MVREHTDSKKKAKKSFIPLQTTPSLSFTHLTDLSPHHQALLKSFDFEEVVRRGARSVQMVREHTDSNRNSKACFLNSDNAEKAL